MRAKCWSENLKSRVLLLDLSVNVRVILKKGLQEIGCEDMGWIDLHQYRLQLVASFCDDGSEPSVSLNGGKFLEYLNACYYS